MKYMRKGTQKDEKKKAMGGYGKIKRKGGTKAEAGKDKSSFGMLSVKAGIDNNPKPTAADRIAGAKKGKKAMDGKPKDKPKMVERTTKRGQRRSAAATAGRTSEELKSIGIQPSKEVSFNKPAPKSLPKARYGMAKPKAKKKK